MTHLFWPLDHWMALLNWVLVLAVLWVLPYVVWRDYIRKEKP